MEEFYCHTLRSVRQHFDGIFSFGKVEPFPLTECSRTNLSPHKKVIFRSHKKLKSNIECDRYEDVLQSLMREYEHGRELEHICEVKLTIISKAKHNSPPDLALCT